MITAPDVTEELSGQLDWSEAFADDLLIDVPDDEYDDMYDFYEEVFGG